MSDRTVKADLCGTRRVALERQTKEKKMGRPLNKRYFGPLADANDPLNAPINDSKFNITTSVKVGTNTVSTTGYILAQRSTTKFLVNDVATGTKRTLSGSGTGNVGVCTLVDKATPADNEMTITAELSETEILSGNITAAVFDTDAITFTSTAHGLEQGDEVTVSNVDPAGFNGTFEVTGSTANTFTVTATDPGAVYVDGGEWTATVTTTEDVRISRLFNRTCRDFDNNRYTWQTVEDGNITTLVVTPL